MNRLLAFVLIVVISIGVVAATSPSLVNKVKLGLDLKGGFEILYEAEPIEKGGKVSTESLT